MRTNFTNSRAARRKITSEQQSTKTGNSRAERREAMKKRRLTETERMAETYGLPKNQDAWNQNHWLTYLIAKDYSPKQVFYQVSWDMPANYHERYWDCIIAKIKEGKKQYTQAVVDCDHWEIVPQGLQRSEIVEYLVRDYYDLRSIYSKFLGEGIPDFALNVKRRMAIEDGIRNGMSLTEAIKKSEIIAEPAPSTEPEPTEPTPPVEPAPTAPIPSAGPAPTAPTAPTPSAGPAPTEPTEPTADGEKQKEAKASLISKIPTWGWVVLIGGLVFFFGER